MGFFHIWNSRGGFNFSHPKIFYFSTNPNFPLEIFNKKNKNSFNNSHKKIKHLSWNPWKEKWRNYSSKLENAWTENLRVMLLRKKPFVRILNCLMNCEEIFILFLINDRNEKGFENWSMEWIGVDEMEGSMSFGTFRDHP
jgi:hypothetical protein